MHVKNEFGQKYVDDVFDKVASNYDVMNDLMSLGVHRLWKDAMVSELTLTMTGRKDCRIIDVAGGSGDIAFRIARAFNQTNRINSSKITICDINENMLAVARKRYKNTPELSRNDIDFLVCSAEELPADDDSFDAYTIAFGIRNVTDRRQALTEALRVLSPGGRFLCLEFFSPSMPILNDVYNAYSNTVIPFLGKVVVGNPAPYTYLVDSIRKFPPPIRFAAMMEDVGFARVNYRSFSGGIVVLHSGWKI